jgi:hypothetical protein
MQEYRAASASHSRTLVVADLDDEIVEMVFPPEAVAWLVG